MIVKKIISGKVIQTYNDENQSFMYQDFIADNVKIEYLNEDGSEYIHKLDGMFTKEIPCAMINPNISDFYISDEDELKIREWNRNNLIAEHKKQMENDPKYNKQFNEYIQYGKDNPGKTLMPPSLLGVGGGNGVEYIFSHTGIGTCLEVKSWLTDEVLDLTNVDNW